MSNVTENARAIATELRRIGSEFQAKVIDEMVDIVERLPKDAEGNPVAIGDTLYADSAIKGGLEGIIPLEVGELFYSKYYGCVHFEWSELYPTREAAEAAREASKQ